MNILAPEICALGIHPEEQSKPVGRILLLSIHKPWVPCRTRVDFVSKVTYSRSSACEKVCAVFLSFILPSAPLLWVLNLSLLVVWVSCNFLWKRLHRSHPLFIVFVRSLYLRLVHPTVVTPDTLSLEQRIMGARVNVVRHHATSRKVAGSIPGEVTSFF
jgi:hypothetical protein